MKALVSLLVVGRDSNGMMKWWHSPTLLGGENKENIIAETEMHLFQAAIQATKAMDCVIVATDAVIHFEDGEFHFLGRDNTMRPTQAENV
jgi:hypothetical protein